MSFPAIGSSPTDSRIATSKDVPYWRDVGTIDAYYQANMDLIAIDPVLNLYDRDWPIRTFQPQLPPPKFVHSELDRRGEAHMTHGLPGLHHLRRTRPQQHPLAERSRQQLRPCRVESSSSTA